MAEYICREDVLKTFKLIAKNPNKDYQRGIQDAIDCLVPKVIADIPATDVQPVKHGKWCGYLCSECNEYADYFISGDFYFDEKPNFCPNCGARMGLKDGEAK